MSDTYTLPRPLTDEQIEEGKKLVRAMTPGPWRRSEHSFPNINCKAGCYEGTFDDEWGIYPPLGEAGPVVLVPSREIAEGVVWLRNNAESLLLTIEDQKREIEQLTRSGHLVKDAEIAALRKEVGEQRERADRFEARCAIRDDVFFAKIPAQRLIDFARSRGWTAKRGRKLGIIILLKPSSRGEVLVPVDTSFRDYAMALRDAALLLAAEEVITPESVYLAIRSTVGVRELPEETR